LSQRIADAVTVRMIGRPFNPEEAVSGLKSYGEGLITLWYQEDYRDDTVVNLPRAAPRPRRRAGRRVAN